MEQEIDRQVQDFDGFKEADATPRNPGGTVVPVSDNQTKFDFRLLRSVHATKSRVSGKSFGCYAAGLVHSCQTMLSSNTAGRRRKCNHQLRLLVHVASTPKHPRLIPL